LGNLHGFNPATEGVSYESLLEIDKWALASLSEITEKVLNCYERYDFQGAYQALYGFVTVTLSARYFDIIKDRLYIYAPSSVERRSAQTALYQITDELCRLLSPILVFTSDEAFENLPTPAAASVHLAEFPKRSGVIDSSLLESWERMFEIRDEVLKALEDARNSKLIGSALEAKVTLSADTNTLEFLKGYSSELRYIFIVSQVSLEAGDRLTIKIDRAEGEKCERCWNYSTHLGEYADHPGVCERCADALKKIG
jgi:isoleucyl-tRNA synthetase